MSKKKKKKKEAPKAPPEKSARDAIRVAGTAWQLGDAAVGDDVPLVRRWLVTLAGTEDEVGRVDRFPSFALALDGADAGEERTIVELLPTTIVEPHTKRETDIRFKSISAKDDILAELVHRQPTKPNDLVDITSFEIDRGARIEILAEDAEYTFTELTELRAAPRKRLVRVTARAIAIGDDAAARLDQIIEELDDPSRRQKTNKAKSKPRQSPNRKGRSRVGHVIGAIGVAILSAAAVMLMRSSMLHPLHVDLIAIGLAFVMSGASLWAFSLRPTFVKRDKAMGEVVEHRRNGPLSVVLMTTATLCGTAFLMSAQDVSAPNNTSLISGITTIVWGAVLCAVFFARTGLKDDGLLARLLDAPALPAVGAINGGLRGSFEGVVSDPSPVKADGEASAIAHVIDETIEPGSNPNIRTERILSEGTFFVLDDRGRTAFEIHPHDALWMSVVRIQTPIVHGKRRYAQVIPIGGSVLIAGIASRAKSDKQGTIRSSGDDESSLVIFAADRGASARQEARALVRARSLALGIVVGCLLANIATLLYMEPRLPPFEMRHSSSVSD